MKVGDILEEFDQRLGTRPEPEILTLTEKMGFVSQRERFNKRLAIGDTSNYKVIGFDDIAFNPYLLWAGAIAQNTAWKTAIISPLYPTFHVRSGFNARFVSYLLCKGTLRSRYDGISFGSVPRKRRAAVRDFLDLPIPRLPSLMEQERIVKFLDTADHLRQLRSQASQRTRRLIPALFHQIFGRHIQSPPVITSRKEASAPDGWCWSRLVDVAQLATGHTPSRHVPEYWNGTIPWISLTDIRALDGTVAQKTSQSVTEKGIENSSSVKLPAGTVCFSRTASVGFVTVMGREMCTSQDFVNWVCGNELEPMYLMAALIQSREYLHSLASGSTHKTIYFPTVEQFTVLLPPIVLQKEFAKALTEVREMETAQAQSRLRLEDLFQSLLHRAFNGDL